MQAAEAVARRGNGGREAGGPGCGGVLGPLEYSYQVFETDHLIKMQPWGGYTRHNRIWKRRTSLIDGMTSEELVTENHAIMMYNPLLSS